MGSVDTVPGMSGGTIAFIFGIYEELVYSVKKLTGEIPGLVLKGKLKEAVSETPLSFLAPLGTGLAAALVTVAQIVTYLLDNQPVLIWSFFFGLLVSSIFIVKKRVVTWNSHDVGLLVASSVAAFFITGLVPLETSAAPLAFFLSGMVAIVAMILPGVSGSFFLVLLGKYEQVLDAVIGRDIVTLALVASGAAVGLAVFSRILSWLFEKHHDIVIAGLTGLMIGSLRKLWPWQETFIPQSFDGEVFTAVILMSAAAALMFYLDRKQATREVVADVEDPKLVKAHKKSLRLQK